MFEYAATLERLIDADSPVLSIDCGFHIWLRGRSTRLARINAPEIKTPEGVVARDQLGAFLAGKTLQIQSRQLDKYGRPLVELTADGATVSDWLVGTGYAVYHTY